MLAIDTQILIWAMKRKPDDRQDMIARTDLLFEQARMSGAKIMVPAGVLGEFLVQYEDSQRLQALALIRNGFFVAPYDANAAVIAARLFQDKEEWVAIRNAANSTRQWIKSDIEILATAIAHGAEAFYVEDRPLRLTANGLAHHFTMPIRELPLPPPPSPTTPEPAKNSGQKSLFGAFTDGDDGSQ